MIHGFIMAPDGTPMHTSLGNVIDPMPILESFGADAMRYYACTCALGEDNAFREKDVVHGKKLITKLYNMGKFVGMVAKTKPEMRQLHVTDRWILSSFSRTVKQVSHYYDNYQFDRAMREVEQFAWHEFADHYIEMVKHRTRDPDDEGVRYTLYTICLGIMKMIAPLMPHVTEEVYQECFRELDGAISIHVSEWPVPVLEDGFAEAQGESIKEVIGAVRNWKSEQKMPLNQEIASIEIIGPAANLLRGNEADIGETAKAKVVMVSLEGALQERVVGIKPIPSRIGPTFKAKAKEVTEALKGLDPEQVFEQLASGKMITIALSDGSLAELDKHFMELQKELTLHGKAVNVVQLKDLVVAIEK